jgi:hypothetical protein
MQNTAAGLALEQHYTPAELAERWAVSQKLVRSIFSREAGVLRVDRPEQRNKRGYCSMRIPERNSMALSTSAVNRADP